MSATPPSQPSTAMTPTRRLALIGFGVFVFVLLLALLELVLWLAGVGSPDTVDDPFVGFDGVRPLFVEAEPGLYRTAEEKLAFFNAQSFAMPKPDDTLRIFAMGGSTTFGRPYDAKVSFGTWLERLLAEGGAGSVEVVNAGGVSYASYRITVLMEELVRYQPDLFVIYTGHNEFLEDRTYSDLIAQPDWLRGLRGRAFQLRSVRALRSLAEPPREPVSQMSAEVQAKLDTWSGLEQFERDDDQREAVLRHFQYNLTRMLLIAEKAGIPVILVKPAANEADFSPFKSQHAPNIDEQARLRVKAGITAAEKFLENGDAESARKAALGAVESDDRYAHSHFVLGQALTSLGSHEEANAAFQRALEEDVCPLRAPNRIGQILDEVAAETNTPLVNFPAMLRTESMANGGHGLLGNTLFLDHVHPRVVMHQRLAEALFETMEQRGLARGASLPAKEKRESVYADAMAGLDRDYYAQRDINLAKVLGWSGKTREALNAMERAGEERDDDPMFHYQRGILLERTDRPGEALASYLRALELAPNLAEAHFNVGKVHQKLGDSLAAETAFARAAELDDSNGEIWYNLGLARLATGKNAGAVSALEAAIARDTEVPMLYDRLGLARMRAGDLVGAEQALLEQVRRTPDNADALFDLGLVHARAGRFAQAETFFLQSIERRPDYAEAHRNLAMVYRQLKRADDEEKALRRAAELRPNNPEAALDVAIYFHRSEQLEEAERWYRKAIAADDRFAPAYANLGAALAGLGRLDEAVAALQAAVERDPGAGDVHFNLARIYLLAGQKERAQDHFREATKLGIQVPATMLQEAGLQP